MRTDTLGPDYSEQGILRTYKPVVLVETRAQAQVAAISHARVVACCICGPR